MYKKIFSLVVAVTFTASMISSCKDGEDGKDGVDGKTPVLSIENCHWHINGTDTGVDACGGQGEPGKDGKDGADGAKGEPGVSLTLEIKDGYWWINGENTNIWAGGSVITIKDGYWYIDGENTGYSAVGQVATINLLLPFTDEKIDPNDAGAFPLTFSWQKVDEVDGYTLMISTDSDFPYGGTYTVNVGDFDNYEMDAAEAEDIVNLFLGTSRSVSTTPFYWTIAPTVQSQPARTQTRRMQAVAVSLLNRVNSIGGCVGLWEFDNASELMKATIGNDLVAYWRVPATLSGIGEPSMQGVTVCDGFNANDGAIEVVTHPTALLCDHGIPANTENNTVSEYTILYDIRPVSSWNALLNTNILNDGNYELALNGSRGVGMSGDDTYTEGYSGRSMTQNVWYCLAVTLKAPEFYHYYVNGERWHSANSPENERLQLSPEGFLFFAAHPNSTQNSIQVSSLAVFDRALSEEELKSLGGL